MIDNDKILKLFKKFAGDPLNIKGLVVTPVRVEQSFKRKDTSNMYFKVHNPNDISYVSPLLEDEIYDETESFEQFINERIDVFLIQTDDFKMGVYLNDELKSRIQKVFDSVKVIEFTLGTPFVGYERYKLFIESVGVSISYWDSESFGLYNNVKVKRAEKNGEWHDPKSVVREYTEIFLPDKETYYETELYYSKIDQILNEYPLMSSAWGNYSSYYDTKFIQ
jgi:hypothetical protein